jgi:hypothetical protein
MNNLTTAGDLARFQLDCVAPRWISQDMFLDAIEMGERARWVWDFFGFRLEGDDVRFGSPVSRGLSSLPFFNGVVWLGFPTNV